MRRVLIWVFVLGTTFVLGRPSLSFATTQRRIAVLDFRNTSQNKELSWLSQAVAETLVTKLGGVASIHVIERGQLDKVIKEQGFGLTDLFRPLQGREGRAAGGRAGRGDRRVRRLR